MSGTVLTILFLLLGSLAHQDDTLEEDLAEFVWFDMEEVKNAEACQDSNDILSLPHSTKSKLLDVYVFFDYQQG